MVWMDIDTEAREEHWRLLYRESKTEIAVTYHKYEYCTRKQRVMNELNSKFLMRQTGYGEQSRSLSGMRL